MVKKYVLTDTPSKNLAAKLNNDSLVSPQSLDEIIKEEIRDAFLDAFFYKNRNDYSNISSQNGDLNSGALKYEEKSRLSKTLGY
jgi:hypothetical protein